MCRSHFGLRRGIQVVGRCHCSVCYTRPLNPTPACLSLCPTPSQQVATACWKISSDVERRSRQRFYGRHALASAAERGPGRRGTGSTSPSAHPDTTPGLYFFLPVSSIPVVVRARLRIWHFSSKGTRYTHVRANITVLLRILEALNFAGRLACLFFSKQHSSDRGYE